MKKMQNRMTYAVLSAGVIALALSGCSSAQKWQEEPKGIYTLGKTRGRSYVGICSSVGGKADRR